MRFRTAARICGLFLLGTLLATGPVFASKGPDRLPWRVGLAAGVGFADDLSEFFTAPFSHQPTRDGLVATTLGYEVGRIVDGALGFEVEGLYGYHFGRQVYHEFGLSLHARWHEFPWRDRLATTVAIGIGPSYTSRIPRIESDKGHESRVLNQFTIEVTGALPDRPEYALTLRMQHRSGMFGLIDGIRGGSDFATLGLTRRF